MKNKRPVKRFKKPTTRAGYQSVARTRGAQVTGEMKYFDTVLALSAIPENNDWTGTEFDPATFLTFCVPVVGAGINQRIGKQIKIHYWKIRGLINSASQADQTAGDPASTIRLVAFIDLQTNSAQAQGEQVMTATASDATAVCTFQNIDNFGRFKILVDRTIVLQNPNMTYDGTNIEQAGLARPFKFTIRFKKPLIVRFNNTNGGTIADIIDNSLHLIANADNDNLAPTISYYSRVGYKE